MVLVTSRGWSFPRVEDRPSHESEPLPLRVWSRLRYESGTSFLMSRGPSPSRTGDPLGIRNRLRHESETVSLESQEPSSSRVRDRFP